MMRKSLAGLVTGAALAVTVPTMAGFIGPDLAPVTDYVDHPKVEFRGRTRIVKGHGWNPRWQCLMELSPYTTWQVFTYPEDTYEGMFHQLERAGVPKEETARQAEQLRQRFKFEALDFLDVPIGVEGLYTVKSQPCLPKPAPAPTEFTGEVSSARLAGGSLQLLVDKYMLNIPQAIRVDAGERVRVYREAGLYSSEKGINVEKLEVLNPDGKPRFSYEP